MPPNARPHRRRPILPAGIGVLVAVAAGLTLAWRIHVDREALAWADVARARADLQRGYSARALEEIRRVPRPGPWEADALTVEGLTLAALDRPEEVRPVLERSLALKPGQPMAAKVLAAVYFAALQTDRGLRMLESVARFDPDDYRPWYAAGEIQLHIQNRPADAIRPLEEALRRRPDHDESRLDLIEARLALGQVDEASPMLDEALRDHPDDRRLIRLATRRARLSGEPEEMRRFAERALANDPDDAEALLTRGQYHQLTDRPREALADAERAVALNPDDLAALNLLARLEHALDLEERAASTTARLREARARSERLGELQGRVKASPDDPEARCLLGRALVEAGKRDLAVTYFRAALSLDPRYRPALDGLAALGVSGPRRPPR